MLSQIEAAQLKSFEPMTIPTEHAGIEQNITRRSIKGGVWVLARRFSTNLIRLVAIAILARHLSPADFGLVALAQVLLQFAVFAQESGIGIYVIHDHEEGWQNRANSAFWLNLTVGLASVVLFVVCLPFIHHFYPQPQLPLILWGLAAAYLLRQFSTIPEALMQKRLEYQPLVLRNTLFDFISASISVVLAFMGFGVWSLIAPQILLEPFRASSIFFIASWKPSLSLGLNDWTKIWNYSKHLVLTNFVGLIFNDGDTLLVGRVLGSSALGFYNLAWQFSNIVNKNISSVIGVVGLPAIALIKADESRLQNAYLKMLHLLSLISFPILCGMFVLAEDLIHVIYGPRWEPVVVLFRVFIVFTLFRSFTSQCTLIFNVKGRTDLGAKFIIAALPFYLISIYLGSFWGILGVSIGVASVRIVAAVWAFLISTNLIHIPLKKVITTMMPVTLLSIAAGIAMRIIWLGLHMMHFSPFWRLGAVSLAGFAFYVSGLSLFDPKAYQEVIRTLLKVIPSRKKSYQPSS